MKKLYKIIILLVVFTFLTTYNPNKTNNLDKKVVEEWISSIPLKRAGNGLDVADTCLFLASDLSSYITGQVLNVSGGLLT